MKDRRYGPDGRKRGGKEEKCRYKTKSDSGTAECEYSAWMRRLRKYRQCGAGGDGTVRDDNYCTWYKVFVYRFFESDGDGNARGRNPDAATLLGGCVDRRELIILIIQKKFCKFLHRIEVRGAVENAKVAGVIVAVFGKPGVSGKLYGTGVGFDSVILRRVHKGILIPC